MSEQKKSFILYLDQKELFDKLPDETAGKLIKHIFSYVNCEEPKADDLIVDIAFSSVKASLKRDLKKWEAQLEQRREAGRISAQKRAERKATSVNERSVSSNETQRNPTDSVSVSVNVSDNVSVSDSNKDIVASAPKFNFKNELLSLGVNKEVLEDWLTVRKKKKASNTKTALKALLNEVSKSGLMVNDAIEYAASKSWSGFKADWYFKEQPMIKQYSDVTAKNIKNLEGDW